MISDKTSNSSDQQSGRYWRRLRMFVVLVALIFLTSYCAGSYPVDAPAKGYRVQCITEISKCTSQHINITLSVQPQIPTLPECHKTRTDLATGTDNFVYCDVGNGGWVFNDVPPKLRGAIWIPTQFAHRGLADVRDYISIGWQQSAVGDVEGVYIAYDSRTTSKPNWLVDRFYPYIDPQTGNPYYIETTMLDESSPSQSFVQLELWHHKPEPLAGARRITISSNAGDGAVWPTGIPESNRAMYSVIVKPKEVANLSQCNPFSTHYYEKCDENPSETLAMSAVKQKALDDCRQRYPSDDPASMQCTSYPKCGIFGSCPDISQSLYTMLSVPEVAFLGESQVEVEKSQSTVIVRTPYGTNVRQPEGKVHFSYLLEGEKALEMVRVHSLVLNIDPISTDIGTFSDISLVLLTPFDAVCVDPTSAVGNPCDKYEIAENTAATSIGFTINNQSHALVIGTNPKMEIRIDHPTRTFRLTGGPLETEVKVGNETVPISISEDITGHFENFAPIVDTRESTTEVECGPEGKNATAIVLSAGASFDVYDPLPPTAYEWYEDFGLVTEKKIGNTPDVVIPPHKISFGKHAFTVLVRDSAGVPTTNTVNVTVGDSKPPELTVPSDLQALVFNNNSIRLGLGVASAWDICSADNVTIYHDAPDDLRFLPGITEITWTADDNRGNIITDTQRVIVFSVNLFPVGPLE